MKYLLKPSLTLLITSAVIIAMLSIVHSLTLEPIERQSIAQRDTAMRQVLPQADEYAEFEGELSGGITAIFQGFSGGEPIGFVLAVSSQGYSGPVDIMVGISSEDQAISGVRILRHSETPGLGALIARDSFYLRFDGRDIVPIMVVRSSPGEHTIDAITSATISTRAVTNSVNEAIEWYLGGGER